MPSSLVKIIVIENLSVGNVIVSLAGEPVQSQIVGGREARVGICITLSVVNLSTGTGSDRVFSPLPRPSTPYFPPSNPVSASGNSY